MTEKDKMLNGDYYIGFDGDLTLERETAKDMLYKFNNLRPSLRTEREKIIQELLGKTGANCWIESPFNCDFGYNISVGDNFYTNTNCCILDCAKVTIGNNVLIGPNVGIYTPDHAFDSEDRKKGYEQALPVEIGDNVWICGGVTITGGVKIGCNSIIGAGSVVTKDIPDNVIAAGVPCKVIRQITEQDKMH